MNDNDEPAERQVGTHTIRFVLSDVVVVTLVGTIEASELVALNEWLNRFAEGKRWVFGIADMTRATSLPMRARQTVTRLNPRTDAVAVIGASRTIRLLVTLLHKAMTMLGTDAIKPLAFVDTEAEAHAFINICRRALEAKASERDRQLSPDPRS